MFTKKTLLVGALVAALGTGALSVGTTFASENGSERLRPAMMTEIVAAIAEEFDLDVAEVQAVVDAEREERREEATARQDQAYEDRLAEAVESGDLTQDQADALLEKRDEMQALAESLTDATPDERKAAMQAEIEELNAWAVENEIPKEYVRFVAPMHRGGQMGPRAGGPGMHGNAGQGS